MLEPLPIPSVDLADRPRPALSASSSALDISPTGGPPLSAEVNTIGTASVSSTGADPEPSPQDGGTDAPAGSEDAPASPGADTADALTEPEAPPKITESLSKLARQRDAEKARADAVQQTAERLAALVEKLAAPKAEPTESEAPAAKTFDEPRPRRADFDDPDAYEDARDDWRERRSQAMWRADLDARDAAVRAKSDKETADKIAAEQHAEQSKIARTFHDRRAKFIETHPDYAEVAESDDVVVSMPMAQIIARTDNGPEIAYWLGQHPERSAEIANMVVPGQFIPNGPMAGQPVPDIARQMFEIGRIAADLAPASTAVARAKPLPKPIEPVGNRAPAHQRTIEDVGNSVAPGSMEEYAAMRAPKLLAERRPNTMIGQRVN